MPLLFILISPATLIGVLIVIVAIVLFVFLKKTPTMSILDSNTISLITTVKTQSIHNKQRPDLQRIIPPLESRIEELFWLRIHIDINLEDVPLIVPQHPVGRYRVDFAIPSQKIAIEVNGYDYHSTKWQLACDAQRTRDLIMEGWRVIPFTGSEIYRDAGRCVRYIAELANLRLR
jgi:very-short-patch-repair endonuclease